LDFEIVVTISGKVGLCVFALCATWSAHVSFKVEDKPLRSDNLPPTPVARSVKIQRIATENLSLIETFAINIAVSNEDREDQSRISVPIGTISAFIAIAPSESSSLYWTPFLFQRRL
jgi:hypothetical protein